jgi:uncharacterized protein
MELPIFFREQADVALAFSGGVDSAYLLYMAIKCGANVRAYYVKSAFQPQFELEDARRMAEHLKADMKIVEADVLSVSAIARNPADRCYHCKKLLLSTIGAQASSDGYKTLIDGTTTSDDAGDRPGIRALRELSVRSPLRECGMTKDDIRRLSKEAGLFTWNKPAYACLATRIPAGVEITEEKLEKTERAENFLFSLGFSDFRIRMWGEAARIQVPASQLEMIMKHRLLIVNELKKDHKAVLLDLEARNE